MRITNTGSEIVAVTLLGTRYQFEPGEYYDFPDEEYDFIIEEVKKIDELEITYTGSGSGPMGPPGPKGDTGDTGPQGIQGIQGEPGISASVEIEEPVGIKDPSNTTLSINDGSRTISISPVSGSFTYFVQGQKFTSSVTKSATWTNTTGLHFFYLDSDETLKSVTTFTTDIITKYAFVAQIYWDASESRHIYYADERHGIHMATYTHLYLHLTRGAQFERGLSLTGFSVDGDGSSDDQAQFTSVTGRIWDEDIRFDIPAQSRFPVLYRLGISDWKRKDPEVAPAASFPLIYNGTVGYTGARPAYNYFNGTSWSLATPANNKWVLIHVLATNDIDYPVLCVLGQSEYASKADARAGAVTELQNLSGLPFAEFVPLGSVIYEVRDSYTNSVQARVVSTDTGANYEDHRGIVFRPGTL